MAKKIAIVLLVLVCFHSCEQVNPTAPEEASLFISANPINIASMGGTSTITVIGYKSTGVPLSNGTCIYFSVDIGTIDPIAKTKDGIAKAVFTSDERSGIAHVYVTSGKATVTPSPLEIVVGSAALSILTVKADPGSLPVQGGRSKITAAAFDENRNPLPGIPVEFSASNGILDSQGKVLFTNKSGSIEDYLTTTKDATVTAISGNLQASVTVTVQANSPPTANFVFSPTDPKVQGLIYFNASSSADSDGAIVSYVWDFSDGSTGSGVLTSHAYASAGTYQVTLVVRDNIGATASVSRSLTVKTNSLPTASFVYSPTNPRKLATVYFNASASSDSDGYIVSYDWDFGDGNEASGVQVSHTYASAGTYQVMLIVKDDKGAKGTANQTVTVVE